MPDERDHRHVGGAAADVDHHVARGLGDGQAGADRGHHRLLDQEHLGGAGAHRRLAHRALLDRGDLRRHADHDARAGGEAAAAMCLSNEVLQHLFRDVEVGDDAVLHGADRLDVARRAAEHFLGGVTHRLDLVGLLVDDDDRGLSHHDAAIGHEDERVGGPQIDREIVGKESEERGHRLNLCQNNGPKPPLLQRFGLEFVVFGVG